jgi:Na+-driven multidrug efflux pump
MIAALVGNFSTSALAHLNSALVYAGVIYILITGSVIAFQGDLASLAHSKKEEVLVILESSIQFSLLVTVISVLTISALKPIINENIFNFLFILALTTLPMGLNSILASFAEATGNHKNVAKYRLYQIAIQALLVMFSILGIQAFGMPDYTIAFAYLVSDVLCYFAFFKKHTTDIHLAKSIIPNKKTLFIFIEKYGLSGLNNIIQKISFMVFVIALGKSGENVTASFFVISSIFLMISLPISGIPSLVNMSMSKFLTNKNIDELSLAITSSFLYIFSAIGFVTLTVYLLDFFSGIFINDSHLLALIHQNQFAVAGYCLMNFSLFIAMALARSFNKTNKCQLLTSIVMSLTSLLAFLLSDQVQNNFDLINIYSTGGAIALAFILYIIKSDLLQLPQQFRSSPP